MSDLAVREMVLYKHGVGFFVRQGEVEGTSTTLTFRADEVNDILKSLAVFDRAGGQVYGVHYQTPMDKEHRLANTSIDLSRYATAVNLLQQVRGREVSLVVEDNKGKQMPYTGRMLGVDRQDTTDRQQIFYVSLLTSDGATHVFPFTSVRQFTIRDEQSKQDLSYFLDTSMTEDNRRTVTIRMSEGEHDLVVQYVAPSPTWRVSYRLVAETDDNGETGTALLQGWGLFDNRFEEDLNEVSVTLVAGQPISFIYDLYASKIPERPIVEDEARVVQAPVEYRSEQRPVPESSTTDYMPPERDRGMDRLIGSGMREERLESSESIVGFQPPRMMAELKKSTSANTETRATGETFQYSVTTPVTVKRGESALVPIISHDVSYERELLYNQAKLPDYPVASLRFENQSGLTLERGPVTLVEDDDYKGEAIIPFTTDNNSVYVPYAVELGVTVKEQSKTKNELHSIVIEKTYAKYQNQRIHTTTYTIENTTDKDKVITIEAENIDGRDLYDTRDPDALTLDHRRWKVSVPANETVDFVRKEREMVSTSQYLRNMTYFDLDRFLKNEYIDDQLVDDLRGLLELVESIKKSHSAIKKYDQERNALYEKQEQLRKNMGALNTTGEEGDLRRRIVDQLRESQDRLEAIDKEKTDLQTAITETEGRITEIIAELGEKYGKTDA